MQKEEDFYQKVEQLEKELWSLVKFALPKLKQEIIDAVQAGGDELTKAQVEQNTAKLKEIDQTISNIRAYVDSMNTDVVACMTRIESLSGKMSNAEKEIASLQENTTEMSESMSQATKDLQEMSTSMSQATKNIQDMTAQINGIQTNIDGYSEQINRLQTLTEQNQTQITSALGDIEQLQSDQQSFNDSIVAVSESVSQTDEKVDSIKKEIDKKIYDYNVSVEEFIDTLNLQDTRWKQYQKNTDAKITNLQDQTTQMETNISSNSQNVTTNAENITALEARILSLEQTALTGGARLRTVIYDMNSEDENINKGFKGGIQGDNTIGWEGDFDYLRIFASIGGSLGYGEFPLANRYRNDALLTNVMPLGNVVHYFKCTIKDTEKQLYVGKGFTYTFDTETNALSLETGYPTTYYITRIEGIRGV